MYASSAPINLCRNPSVVHAPQRFSNNYIQISRPSYRHNTVGSYKIIFQGLYSNFPSMGIEPTISGLEGHALPVEPRVQSLMIIVGLKMDVFQIVPK
jgi:hypothetical protein